MEYMYLAESIKNVIQVAEFNANFQNVDVCPLCVMIEIAQML